MLFDGRATTTKFERLFFKCILQPCIVLTLLVLYSKLDSSTFFNART
jgi:hypothetical protein